MSNVLVIAPHPDDAELGVGGTIIKHKLANDSVTVFFVCSSNFKNRTNEYADIRTADKTVAAAHNSAQVLGCDDVIFGSMEDQTLDKCIFDVVRSIEGTYYSVLPDIVYIPFCYDNNQDHRAVFEAMQVICRPTDNHTPRQLLMYETPSCTDQIPGIRNMSFVPNYYSVLSEDMLDKKVESMKCYTTEIRNKPHPRSEYGIRQYARFRGLQCGEEYAEAFCSIRQIY